MGGTIVRTASARVLVGAALVVAAVGVWSTAAVAKTTKVPKPTIAGLSATPPTVTGPSGYVHLSAASTGATSCTFTTTAPAVTITPAAVACSSGAVASTLFVPEDNGKRAAKVPISLTATGPGGTKSAKLTVVVDPGDGGRSVPGPPAGVVATASDRSASVSVTPPASTGGEPVESYTVTAVDLTSPGHGGPTATGSSSPLTVTGLVDGDTYWFSATATNSIGTGPASGNSNEVIPDAVPGTPTGVTAAAGDQAATVAFAPPGSAGADTTYQVVATDLTTSTNGGQAATGHRSPITVAGLTDGDAYVFTVQATDAAGLGPVSLASDQVTPEPVPGAPTSVTAVAGDTEATVLFAPPGNAAAGTTYQVAAADLTTSANGGQAATGSSSPITLPGLTDGDAYEFTVQATDAVGSGPRSLASNQVTPERAPGTPTAVMAVAGNQQATVTFVPATSGDPPTSFTVTAIDHTSAAEGGQIAVGASPVTVTGLTDGDTYTFTVTAQIGTIASAPSLPSNAVTPAAILTEVDQAIDAGQSAYLTSVSANPDLVQCSTGTAATGTCDGIQYGSWYPVDGSPTEYYAFGNPQPTFDPTTHAVDYVTIQIAGAVYDPSAADDYDFGQETIAVNPANGLLDNVWWSNLESFNATGDYSGCNYNWLENYDIDNGVSSCSPIYFGPNDYLFGPVFTNDSVFVTGAGGVGSAPSFGTASSPSAVRTADPNCLFVDPVTGMSGSSSNCSTANGDVAVYDPANSSYANAVEAPPSGDAQLGAAAAANGCLYSGPTQVTLSTVVVSGRNVGRMTVTSPDTGERTVSDNGTPVTWDDDNLATNFNDCPNNGSADLPSNGVVYVEDANSGETVTGANPFDDLVADTVTNLTASPTVPTAGGAVVLTATVTSSVNQIGSGATAVFSQTVSTTGGGTTTSPIGGCSPVADWSTPVPVGNAWQSTVTCSTTEASNGTGAFSAAYSGGTATAGSQGKLGQTNVLVPGTTYGPDPQTVAGGCTGCYFGQTTAPDAEGDAFVNGSLSGELTIGTQNDVVIDGNLTYADCAGRWATGQSGQSDFCPYSVAGPNDSLGLIADQYVEVNHPVAGGPNGSALASCASTPGVLCDAATPSGAFINGTGQPGLTIDATVFAVNQSFVVNNWGAGSSDGQLAVYGSVGQFARGPVGTFSGTEPISGYAKHYTWDPLLGFLVPPGYLDVSTPSWVLGSVDPTGGGGSTTGCPALSGVYAGTDSGGVIEDGPAVTQSCVAPSGGLPGYP